MLRVINAKKNPQPACTPRRQHSLSMVVGATILEVVATHLLAPLVVEVLDQCLRRAAERTRQSRSTPSVPQRPRGVVLLPRDSNVTVLSHLPGRARLHVAPLRGDPVQARKCQASLRRRPGVRTASVSAATGNVLVQYEPDQTTLAQIQAALEQASQQPQRRRPARRRAAGNPQLVLVGT
jgi:hypothetical protein